MICCFGYDVTVVGWEVVMMVGNLMFCRCCVGWLIWLSRYYLIDCICYLLFAVGCVVLVGC
jgi:hypothetical protein